MRILAAVLLMVEIAVSQPLLGQEHVDATRAQTLADAVELVGVRATALPIALATSPPDTASSGVEAWILSGDDGRPRQIVVYTESEVFRCANRRNPDWQCRLKLASIIVHEAWHFNDRADEARAYDEQLAFLIFRGATSAVVSGVRRSRDHAVARQRKLLEMTRNSKQSQYGDDAALEISAGRQAVAAIR